MRLLFILLLSALVACSSNDDVDLEPVELVKFKQSAKVKRVWAKNIGHGAGENFNLLPLAAEGNRLFAVDEEGLLVALDRSKGKKLWQKKLKEPVGSGVGVYGGQLYLGTLNGEVLAFSADTGAELWRAEVSSEILAPPQSNGQVAVAQTQDGRLFGFDASNGDQIWMQEVPVPALTLRGTATPVVTDTAVYAGFASGKMMALNVQDGTLLWEQRVALSSGRTELERVVDINAAPLLVGDLLYVGSYQGRLIAINRGTGGGLWAVEASTYNMPAAGRNNIYIADQDSVVKAYNATTGDLVWENDQLLRRGIGAPQTFGDYVAVADFEGYVHIMNQSDGQFVARDKIDGAGVRTPMLSIADVLYVYGNSGDLEALTIP